MNINTLTSKLMDSWFAHIADISPWLSFTPQQQQHFGAWWDNLVRDENFRQYTHRERRILRYHSVNGDPARLEINPDANFQPTVTYDIKYQQGVNLLSYAEQGFIADALLQQIIHFDQSLLYAVIGNPVPVTIDVHQFRVKASAGQVSPTTSGIHQDGFDWIFMHFIHKHNAQPVISEIFSQQDEGSLVFSKEMSQFLETLVVNDKQCWHRASSVEPCDNQSPGWRDLLLVTCRYLPGTPL
ncbi:TPA: 2OG-Fe dioxygenase family protein [Salmonella enterica subsp. houtenae serovar 47:z36:-]|nr:2OG-Fe dioxygenase family protein [Salmonella enterica]HCM1977427.1 2OG-Fe dioxygenase family protein [Salmonella enterica subsp. houtenae serovar 47:z36:-]